ncbi:MAG: Cas10/Cmr2 second palm domain-containing protein, partial [Actinomycetes bacterium]
MFLAPAGTGPAVARAAAEEVRQNWRAKLGNIFKAGLPPTPGMPDLAWVSVTGPVTDYEALWRAAREEMDGRRRARVFEPVEIPQSKLCAQSPGLPAVLAPPASPRHERDEALSAAGWAKRRAGDQRFPSTVGIASSAFRRRLLHRASTDPELAATLHDPVRTLTAALNQLGVHTDRSTLRGVAVPPGLEPLAGHLGGWVTPGRWDGDVIAREYGTTPDERTVRDARAAAGALAAIARNAGIPAPSPYFAIVVQDLDRLGQALGNLDLHAQRDVSTRLSILAAQQTELLTKQHPLAVVVYAGGDDFLAFCPAAEALQLAASLREQVRVAVTDGPLATAGPDGAPITASTAVVFAHMSNPLQDALRAAHQAITDAKSATSRSGRSR